MELYKIFTKLCELPKKRSLQLAEEKKIDSRLEQCHTLCSKEVSRHLFLSRELNRKHFEKTFDVSPFQYAEETEKSMKEIDSVQKIMDCKDIEFSIGMYCFENIRPANELLEKFLRN